MRILRIYGFYAYRSLENANYLELSVAIILTLNGVCLFVTPLNVEVASILATYPPGATGLPLPFTQFQTGILYGTPLLKGPA